jgi:hypothetical protein
VRNRFVELGFEIFPRDQQTPGKLGEMVQADAKKWWPFVGIGGILAQDQ